MRVVFIVVAKQTKCQMYTQIALEHMPPKERNSVKSVFYLNTIIMSEATVRVQCTLYVRNGQGWYFQNKFGIRSMEVEV